MLTSLVVLITLLASGCQTRSVPQDNVVALSPDLPDSPSDELTAPQTPGNADWPDPETLTISLQRTPCLGRCPIYRLEFFSDGTVRYQGSQFTDRIGTYRGKIDPQQLQAIFDQAEKIGFGELAEEYPTGSMRITDLPAAILTIRGPNWEKMVVNRNYANPDVAGEQEIVDLLNALQSAVDTLLTGLAMERVGEGKQD